MSEEQTKDEVKGQLMEMIHLEHVSKSFGEQKVLDDLSLDIREGEILTVIGRSGSTGFRSRIQGKFMWTARMCHRRI